MSNLSKLNKVVNGEMFDKIVNSISDKTIVDFYPERTDINEYVSILKKIDDYIFEHLDQFKKQVNDFEDFEENEDTIYLKVYFEFEFMNERQEVCFYVNKEKLLDRLLDMYTNII